ncbi:hypothetical protein EPIB1_1984 [Tritonibacter mobilis]|nr:hypothetical protein SCH4B_4251 [Ruegeria sp. TrichCH4B]VCU59086.1 hypothetical protein EPIB1_1984 [Tritonibacter mobilis]
MTAFDFAVSAHTTTPIIADPIFARLYSASKDGIQTSQSFE